MWSGMKPEASGSAGKRIGKEVPVPEFELGICCR
jgi:hypothetical protein